MGEFFYAKLMIFVAGVLYVCAYSVRYGATLLFLHNRVIGFVSPPSFTL